MKLQEPFTMLICGPSKSGKSSFVHNLLKNSQELFTRPIGPVHYFYKIKSSAFDSLTADNLVTEFHQGPCTSEWMEENLNPEQNPTIIIDDQASEIKKIEDIFTVTSHHMNTNVIFISQSTFSKNPSLRIISTNCTYLVLMKNVRDLTTIRYLARQVDPINPETIILAYQDATKKPFSHFMFDFNQSTPNYLRYRANIFKNNEPFSVVYMKI